MLYEYSTIYYAPGAGALTVGKLALSDVSDPTNEGRVFSFIGIAIGSGCITGPAIGGYLADGALMGARVTGRGTSPCPGDPTVS